MADRLVEDVGTIRRNRMRRLRPMMFEEAMHLSEESSDPVGILMAASMVRDEAPWLYELAMEVYKAVKSGDRDIIEVEMARLRKFSDFMLRGPFMEEFGFGKDSHMFLMEFPRMLDHMLRRSIEPRTALQHSGRSNRARSAVDKE